MLCCAVQMLIFKSVYVSQCAVRPPCYYPSG